ncbi:hypothetical protein WMY93_013095 [Mugilogobius chulae]|uniref:E3 ubiquitin-protein ligase Topors n=1 Tax=Mugilogobius chulae TaxID=88201 RepID=A0AAW0P545_9GOBI
MSGYTPDEKLRFDQLVKLRRQWLKDQELSPREPVIQAKPPGAIAKFWAGFLEPKSLWRIYTYKAYRGGVFTLTRLLIPAWIVHYYVKYHVTQRPYGIVELKPKLFPGDTVMETGESEIMSAIKIALQHNQRRGKRKSGEMSTEVSPDSKCPICLDLFNNISYLDLCLHKFCFRCIHEWSKNKAECPLCKQPFNSIYHSIKSEQDFKKYDLKPADNGSFGTFGGVRFRYRTTLTGVHRQMHRTVAPPENGVMFEATTNAPPQRQDRYIRRIMTKLASQRRAASEGRSVNNLREQEMINFRKELYRQGLRVRSVRDGGRSRDTSAEFYRRNPACLHRLIPWLKRELTVLYGAHGSLVNIVQHIVMSRITRYDVEDGAMLEELRPFLQGCTEHFLHEFISFAKSPFNMEAYDQHAVYDFVGPFSADENSSNSSVIAISEDEDQSVELDPPGDLNSTNMSHSMWDDETPGPSYSTQSEPSRVEPLSLPHSDSDSSLEENQGFQAFEESVSPLNQKEETPNNECFSSAMIQLLKILKKGFVYLSTFVLQVSALQRH